MTSASGWREGATRRFLAMLLMLGAAGCQTPSDGADEGSGTPPDYRNIELSDLLNDWFRANIASRCAYGAVPEECAKIMLLSAFDETGQAGDNCPPDTGLDEFGECVIFGSFARELLIRQDPALVDEVNWLAPRSSIAFAFDTVSNNVVAACYGAEAAYAVACFRGQLAESLGLTGYSASVCGSDDVEDWKRCMLKEYLSNELLEASARM